MSDNTEYLTYRSKIEILVQAFPEVFHKKLPRPLKIGVHNDLNAKAAELNLTEEEIQSCLSVWTQRREYILGACRLQRRYDLDGSAVEVISLDHLQGFANRLARMYSRLNRNFIGMVIANKKGNSNE